MVTNSWTNQDEGVNVSLMNQKNYFAAKEVLIIHLYETKHSLTIHNIIYYLLQLSNI